jgi:hypothetical protein
MPSRADLDVSGLKPWLGNLALIDIAEDGRAVFRLCGTNLHARFGGERTRHDVSALDTEIGQSFRDCISRVRRTGAPAESGHERVIDGAPAAFRELCVPLSDDGVHIQTLLFASFPVTKR